MDAGSRAIKMVLMDGENQNIVASGSVDQGVEQDRLVSELLGQLIEQAGIATNDIGQIAEQAVKPTPISSMCVVFAETEIIGLLASRETPANIVGGVQVSITSRVSAMVGRKAVEPIIFTGGVALIRGMAQAIESEIGHPVSIATNPQFTGALGAALLACELA